MTAIVDAVRDAFGIHPKVSPQLYKLLVYEKGSFFAPHRDTEKAPGMFATLVVCLPSRHEGGSLIIKHDGQTKRIDFGGKNAEFKTQYAAFYADCQHEITPVTSGYRVCLVYNLAIAGKKQQPAAPQNAPVVEKAAQLLAELFADESSGPSKIAIAVEHKYTEAGLDPKQLKGRDRARFDLLVRAAESLDCQCFLALLTHHQSGEADYDTLDYGRSWGRRSDRWSYDEDEDADDDDESDDSGAEMGEVHEEELSLDHWLDPHGVQQPFGEMHLKENEILNAKDRDGWLIKQEVHEATGNEGVSMDRWYRHGVIVIWPRNRYFGILAREGPASAVPALEKMAGRSKKPATLEACRTFAEEIIRHWKPQQRFVDDGHACCSAQMLKLLERIGTPELVERFLRDVLPKDFDGSEGKALHRLFQQFGWAPFAADMCAFIAQANPKDYRIRLAHIVSICEHLCCAAPALTDERLAACRSFVDPLMGVIERWDAKATGALDDAWDFDDRFEYTADRRTGIVASVVRILTTISATEPMDRFLSRVLADTAHYNLRKVVIPDIQAMYKWAAQVPAAMPAVGRLLDHCLTMLRSATAQPIEPPQDWTRDADLDCKCADCAMLSRFLRDPAQRVARFPLNKQRRQHLHQRIDMKRCDVTHVTERGGSPQTLVCTKTQRSYERRVKQFDADTKLLAELEALAGARRVAVRRSSVRPATKRR